MERRYEMGHPGPGNGRPYQDAAQGMAHKRDPDWRFAVVTDVEQNFVHKSVCHSFKVGEGIPLKCLFCWLLYIV